MPRELTGELRAQGLRLAIVVSRFTGEITDRLLAGALAAIGDAGGDVESVPVARVPGSMELAVVARKFAAAGYDAVICIGCIIRGETSHYDCVVDGTTRGITAVAAETGVPVIFGVLTCDDYDQALARADDAKKLNTGAYAARAAIEMVNLMKKLEGSGFRVQGSVHPKRETRNTKRRSQASSLKPQA